LHWKNEREGEEEKINNKKKDVRKLRRKSKRKLIRKSKKKIEKKNRKKK
jgi:hypothetical protein